MFARVATKLEIRKLSEKLKTVREIRKESGNFAQFPEKLKFLAVKKFDICIARVIRNTNLTVRNASASVREQH